MPVGVRDLEWALRLGHLGKPNITCWSKLAHWFRQTLYLCASHRRLIWRFSPFWLISPNIRTTRQIGAVAPYPFAGARGQSVAARPFIRELRTNDELRLLAQLGRPDQLSGRLNRLTRSRRTSQWAIDTFERLPIP